VKFDCDQRSDVVDLSSASGYSARTAIGAAGVEHCRIGVAPYHSAAKTPRYKIRRRIPATVAQISVAEAVDCEVEAGVQVRQHGRVQVNGQRQTVRSVVYQHDNVRAPAADERDEDNKNCFHLTNGLHRCNVTGFSSVLLAKPKHRQYDVE